MKTITTTIIMGLLSLTTLTAKADVISCHFTEPFFAVEIDTNKKTIKMIEPDWGSSDARTITKIISRKAKVDIKSLEQISDAGHVPVYAVYSGHKEVMTLRLDYQGSDSMSDFAYPYSTSFEGNMGGCESEKLKSHTFNYEGDF